MLTLFYFAWISLLVSVLLVWTAHRARKENFPFQLFLNISGVLLISLPLGARLFHVFYEAYDFYFENPLKVLFVWQGGFVYYGGLLTGLLASVLYFKLSVSEKTFFSTADFFTPALNLGTGLGRVACYVQGCCFGSPWPFSFPTWEKHPTQLYLMTWEVLIFFGLDSLKSKLKNWGPGSHFMAWIGLSALGRFFIEFLRVDFRGALILRLSVSQWIALSLIIMAGLVLVLIRFRYFQPAKPK
ncbi:MAG: prolipoprotein diacylglyceryl transferase [Bdellovibrionales bacterium]